LISDLFFTTNDVGQESGQEFAIGHDFIVRTQGGPSDVAPR